ncbi:MAG: hypothetical protein ABL864_05500 [Terricaulis sp.]
MSVSVSVGLELEGAGWASFEFTLDGCSYRMDGVSHVFDPMDDLLRAGAMVARSPSQAFVRFFGEPMEWRLHLSPLPTNERNLLVEIGTFPGFGSTVGTERGEIVLSGMCDRMRFARTLLNAFWSWSTKEQAYLKLWYEPFPRQGFDLLQTAVSH